MAYLPSIFDRSLNNLNPFRSVAKMQRQMDRIFDRMMNDVGMSDLDIAPNIDLIPTAELNFAPACTFSETDSHYLLSFDVPGVKKEDLKIELRGHTLIVSGERKEEWEQKKQNQYRSESNYGSFQRAIELAEDVKSDQVEAQFDNGVLRVAVPKTKASRAETIKIAEGKTGIWEKLLSHKKEETKQH